jgi:hypothetical protein
MQSEAAIQAQIVQYFNNTYCLVHHNPRGLIFHVPNQNQYKLTNIGVLAGVSDLIVILPNRALIFVEVKDNAGKQSDKQRAFECRVDALGYTYAVVRSLEEFKNVIAKLA